MHKVQDNGNIYPFVEGDPADPVYAPGGWSGEPVRRIETLWHHRQALQKNSQ
jgi:hypothetical protein